ncbi:MAG: hypothetical protein WC702_01800 [Patescibacteria group bacterium]|jgi:hypothetical protein
MIEKKSGPVAAKETEKIPPSEKKESLPQRHGHGRLWGCLFLFLILLLAVVGLAWIVAASGLINVPVLSSLAYKTPAPLHVVAAGAPLETYISETFGAVLTERLQSGAGSLADRSVELSLSENSITTSFRTLLKDNNLSFFSGNLAQVAIDERQGVEIFLPIAGQSNGNALRFIVIPAAKDGLVVAEDIKIKIGNLSIPSFLTNIILKPIINNGLSYLNQEIGRYALIDRLETTTGFLKVFGTLTVEIMKIE